MWIIPRSLYSSLAKKANSLLSDKLVLHLLVQTQSFLALKNKRNHSSGYSNSD